ncbi:MAG: GxxExxY protein [Bacteroidetes bacterium]|jgi:GxxExxY protein|nr:GxxExxY protein [Bacteroidota bacterium]MCK4406126.1 GxxExxY protein [Bacteroidales bacterium]MCK4638436.1 GxxExxY protein [Bacteroidales bacterium]
MKENYLHTDITGKILKAFFKVYNTLGYGFLEKVYENAMLIELRKMGLKCSNQLPIKVFYENEKVGDYYSDILVEDKVIVELKAIEALAPEHETILVNYLKGTEIEVGLLLNFGPKPQYKRRVLTKEYLRGLKK